MYISPVVGGSMVLQRSKSIRGKRVWLNEAGNAVARQCRIFGLAIPKILMFLLTELKVTTMM